MVSNHSRHDSVSVPVPGKDYFKELGVRTFINAAGTYTRLTGSLLLPEVVRAMMFASHEYVDLNELQDRVGEHLASLLGCEDEVVTSGAASAITFGTAGVLTGMDENRNQLRTGHPSIETVGGTDMIEITTWMMTLRQERIVARRIKEILEASLK